MQIISKHDIGLTRMWANVQPDGRPADIGGALCSTPQSLADAHYQMPCSNAAKTQNPLKFAGVPKKLPNRSQPLVGRSSPYCGDMWRTYRCLTSFSDCRCVPQLRRYSPTKLCDGAQMAFLATFLRPAFPVSRVQHVSDLHLKFALRPHHVWKYGRHPISDR